MSPVQDETAEVAVEKRRISAAERITNLACEMATKMIFDGEHAYIVLKVEDHVRTFPIESKAFKRWISGFMVANGHGVPSSEASRAASLTLTGIAAEGGIEATPTIRVAGDYRSAIYIDLGDESWNCVKVTAQGWEIVPHPLDGPYMYRPPKQAALPMPERGGDVHELWNYVNVLGAADRWLIVTWLLQSLWPRGPYPLLAIFGEHGAAKTSFLHGMKALVDPTRPSKESYSPTSLSQPPREPRDVVAKAYNARIIAFDNVSFLNQDLSDVLCRLATGAEVGGRALFSDFDEATFSAVRPVMLNGIPDVVSASDLADRTIKIEAQIPARRIEESELWEGYERAWPRILGGLLDLLSQVMANYPAATVPKEHNVRMVDFARIGEAFGLSQGWAPGTFTAMYHENRQNAAREIAEQDPVTPALRQLISESGGQWVGPTDVLLTALNRIVNPGERGRSWPTSCSS